MGNDGALDEAYERLHRTGPEYEGWLTNHGPMAVESMVRRGQERVVHRWLDRYAGRLEELPRGTAPIDVAAWREALGDARRLGDWLAYFDRELRSRPWREVLATWWPRLLPGIAAGATHGVIRTGHAVHTLLRQGEAPGGPRLAELGQALGYWAARWQPVPAAAPGGTVGGTVGPQDALAAVRRVPDQSQGIRYRLGQLAGLPGWAPALRPAGSPEQARLRLAELADAATLRYLTHGHGSGVMLVHAATAPTAVLRALPALPATMWAASLDAAWAASAAVTAAYAPAEPAPRAGLPAASGTAEEVFDRAVRHGDEHVIKLADTCLEVHERTGEDDALAAAVRATELIPSDG
jgi:Questin oxidase-like